MSKINRISEMTLDRVDEITLLLTEITEKTAKNGKPYCELSLTDGEDDIVARMFDSKKEDLLKESEEMEPVTVMVKPQIFNGQTSHICSGFRKAPAGTDKNLFRKSSDMPSEEMFTDIVDGPVLDEKTMAKINRWEKFGGLPRFIKNPDLLRLVTEIYRKNKDAILKSSAAKRNHHAYYGGLLDHTYRMLISASALSVIYRNMIDMNVLLAATALHDIGKIVELETTELGVADYTVEGSMLGHTVIGINMVEKEVMEAAASGNPYTDLEKILMVKHCIAAHHGTKEWGAAALPLIPEALVLHQIDMIDSGVKEFQDAYKKTEPGQMSQEKVFAFGRYVYRPAENKA